MESNCQTCTELSKCLTCGPSPDKCITCNEGFFLTQANNICLERLECSIQDPDIALINCLTCDFYSRKCLTCDTLDNRVLKNGVCVCSEFYEKTID